MDEVDAPMKPQRPRVKNSFQQELDAKMRHRRSLGLAADVTPSEDSDDDDGGEEELLAQYSLNATGSSFMKQRPSSAKRRPERSPEWKPDLSQTLHLRDADSIFNKHRSFDDEDQEVAGFGSKGLPRMDGSWSSREQKKPSPRESTGLFGRKTPTGKHTPTEEMSKEDIIFGRKTPTLDPKNKSNLVDRRDSIDKKQWHPPSFRKSPVDYEQGNRTPSPAGSRGRKTPSLEPLLDPISEAATPRSRERPKPRLTRQSSTSSDKQSPRQFSVDSSPRSDKPTPRPRGRTNEQEVPKGRTTPTLDVFGKPRRTMDLDDEDETKKETLPRFKRQGVTDAGRKTPPGRKIVDGKTGYKTPVDRKTPTGRKTPTDRKTTTGRKSPSKEVPKQDAGRVEKKQASLLDFLTGEPEVEKRGKPEAQKRQRPDFKKSKTDSRDSISDEVSDPYNTVRPQPQRRKDERMMAADESSLCEELEHDPFAPVKPTSPSAEKQKKSHKQTSEKQKLEDAISEVAVAQDDMPKGMKYIEPDKNKEKKPPANKDKVSKHKPKPRYPTLPGQSSSSDTTEQSFEDTVSIRQAIYDEWYQERMKKAKQQVAEQKKKQKEEEDKKKKEKEDKMLESKASYQAWVEQKKESLHNKARQKKEEEKKKQEELQQKEEKEKEANLNFKIWKESKDSIIKDKQRNLKKAENEKKERENEEKRLRHKYSESAFTGWKVRKDQVLIKKAVEEKKLKKNQAQDEEEMRAKKDEDAAQKYEEWLKKKEKREKTAKLRRIRSMESEIDFRPAWSPANRTIPFGR